jgi:hypothetical protein
MMNLFPWFLRNRASDVFRPRLSARDQQADAASIQSIAATIERSLSAMEAERVGLPPDGRRQGPYINHRGE